ncbi:hypothetical protein H4P12_11860 [Paracoccus sp. 11-3]|uniref:Pyrroline-5-carboxylate reductase n=1 Tax=Paracoccus amoyensis TaxID=2760093 RepID=A0A926JDB3_9RHOB|nr:pyrroline-5-carboxylate reductase dimerization domain-containing protein [Paracoccus amoyensis]MBC9247389.1 hypothetical protein [Paracoccus amoyensis]
MTDGLQQSIALIGASGWLGRSVGPALLRQKLVAPQAFIAANRSGRSPHYDDWPDLRWTVDAGKAAQGAEIVILSVLPQDFGKLSLDCTGKLVISFMAGVSCAEIARRTGADRVVRTLPNAAVQIGRSYSPWFATDTVTVQDKETISAILSSVGETDQLQDESDLAAITILSGAGPAYAALLAKAFLDAALAQGLSPDIAAKAVKAMVCDAPVLMADRIDRAGEIVRDYMDYRGTTAAALSAAQEAGFEVAVHAAVQAGMDKVKAMSN